MSYNNSEYSHASSQTKIVTPSPRRSSATPPPTPRKQLNSNNSLQSLVYSESSNISVTSRGTKNEKKQKYRNSPRAVMNFEKCSADSPLLRRNSSKSSNDSKCRSSSSMTRPSTPLLEGNLLRRNTLKEDPTEYYDVMDVLGKGSMGNVIRAKKRKEAIGGSARPSYVRRKREILRKYNEDNNNSFAEKIMQSCFFFCAAPFAVNKNNTQDLFQAVPDNDEEKDNQSSIMDSTTTVGEDFRSGFSINFDNGSLRDVLYAIKTVRLDLPASSNDFSQELEQEVEILKNLDHPNIIRVFETFQDHDDQQFMVMECCEGGNLFKRSPYTEQNAAKIIHSVLSAVAYMHSRNIIHRDIKYENILFTSSDTNNFEIKLVDFGLSKRCTPTTRLHAKAGTPYTMAPELLKGSYSLGADIWSIGVVTYMLLFNTMPFPGKDRNEMFRKILKGRFRLYKNRWWISDEARQFASILLQRNPSRRPTAKQCMVMTSPWVVANNNIHNDTIDEDETKDESDFNMSSNSLPYEQNNFRENVIASMQNFSDYGILKKLTLLIVAYQSTNEEIGILKEMFTNEFVIGSAFGDNDENDESYLDDCSETGYEEGSTCTDSDNYNYNIKFGEINFHKFKSALIFKDHFYNDFELERMFFGIDIDNKGYITYNEFLAATLEAHYKSNNANSGNMRYPIDEERLAEAFDRLDCNDDGYITKCDMKQFLGYNSIKQDDEENFNANASNVFIERVIDEIDFGIDERIAYHEFLEIIGDDNTNFRADARKCLDDYYETLDKQNKIVWDEVDASDCKSENSTESYSVGLLGPRAA